MLETLILCMALDYLTGMMAAGIFHKSKKSAEGGLESRSGWKGLCRKGISLLIVLVSYRMDLIAGTDFICNAVMAAYLVNELLSITENLGLMGVPVRPGGDGWGAGVRRYDETDLRRLKFIRAAQSAGFTLEENSGKCDKSRFGSN